MRDLVVVLCIGSVFSFLGYNAVDEYDEHGGKDSSEEDECSCCHLDFLKGLPKKALSEYYRIAQNTSQSLEVMEKSLERWAKKYNVEDKYEAHVADESKKFEAFKKSLTDLTKKLTTFFKSYIKIGNDKKKSYDTMYKETQELFNALNEKEKGVVSHILSENFGNGGSHHNTESNCQNDLEHYGNKETFP